MAQRKKEIFLSSSDRRKKQTKKTHAETEPLAHHSFTSICVHATDVVCDRACVCIAVLMADVGLHRRPPPPCWDHLARWCQPQRANMKLDTTRGG